MRVDSARHTVRDFDVELGDNVLYGCTSKRGPTMMILKDDAPWYTLASLISRTAAVSTMLRTVKRLMALSFGTHREQLEQRTKLTWPRPFLLRPLFLLFLVCTRGAQGERSANSVENCHSMPFIQSAA